MEPLFWGFVVSVLVGSIQFHDNHQAPGHLQQYQSGGYGQPGHLQQYQSGGYRQPGNYYGHYSGDLEQPHRQAGHLQQYYQGGYGQPGNYHDEYTGDLEDQDRQAYPTHNNHRAPSQRLSHHYGDSFTNETCIPFLGLGTTNFKLANLDPTSKDARKCISSGSLESVTSVDCSATQYVPSQLRWGIIPKKMTEKIATFQLQNQGSGKCMEVPKTSKTSDGRYFPTLETCDKAESLQIFRAYRCTYSTGSDGKMKLDHWRLETTINEIAFCLTHNPEWPPNPHFYRCDDDKKINQLFSLIY
jgi:hypothetical protein